MKVCLDISQTAYRGGVATYTKNLAVQLQKLGQADLSFFYSSLRIPYTGFLKNVKSYPFPQSLNKLVFNNLRFVPIELLTGKVDVFHSSDWIQPPTKAKKVTTYHDVIPLKYPQWSHPQIVSAHRKRLQIVEKEIDKVIAVSETTKKDLLEISSIPAEKIIVIYEGVDKSFRPLNSEEKLQFKSKYNLPDEFVLAVGGIGERRNLERVKKACTDYNLIITGQDLYVSDEDYPLLLGSAQVLIYPSLYEGFGLPIIEAMAAGVPVVTSNISSMAEIAADAAVLVDPLNTESITEGLRNANKNKYQLIQRGLEQAKKFSWEKSALETMDVYKSLC